MTGGHKVPPPSERSDWTEQDLLTLEEALPRLEESIEEVRTELEAATDPRSREEITNRLAAMERARDDFKAREAASD